MSGKQSFGQNIEELMTQKRYTVSTLAKELKVPAKTVHEWVGKNARMPRSPEVIRKLAELLGVSIYFLMFGEEDPRNPLNQFLEKNEIHTGLYEITIKKVNPKNT